jgi:crossover junction endodeoxyribonuclease RuvC
MSNVLSVDPGINGGGNVLDRSSGIVACFDIPTIGDGVQRRVDPANLADIIREHGPYTFAIVEQVGARPGQGVSSMFRFGQAYGTILGVIGALAIPVRHLARQMEKGAQPQQRRRNLPRSSDRDMANAC